MQNLARDEAGNVWELDAQGNAVRMVEPAAPATGRVFTLPQSPKDARQEQRQADADERARRAQARADEKERREQLEWDATHNPDGSPKPKPVAADAKAAARKPKLDALVEQIKRVESLYKTNVAPEELGLLSSLADYLPTEENSQFNTAAAGLAEQGLAAFRVPGVGAQSDTELRQFVDANKPSASNYDTAIEEKLRQLKVRVDADRQSLGMEPVDWNSEAQQKADNEVLDPTTGANLKPPAPGVLDATTPSEGGGGPAAKTVASGGTRSVFDARVSAQIDAMVNAGASKGMIDAVLKKQNFPVVTPSEWTAIQTWRKQNPGKRYYGANISRSEDLNLLQRAAGSETGAFLTHMANNATAGIPAALAGPEGQGALDAMAANSPNAALAGGVLGGVTGALGAEATIAARAPAALAKYAPRISDTLYGGLLGFNTAREGEGVEGALIGAGAGLLGGYAGDKALKGVASITRGIRNPYVQTLRDKGVPLSVGETVGDSGRLGAMIRGAEDRMSGFWGVGDVIRDRQREGVEAVAERMANDAVAPIEGSAQGYGEATVNDLLQQGSDAYRRATAGAHVPLDPQFATDLAQTRAIGTTLPDDLAARFERAITNRIGPVEADTYLTGDTFQQAVRGLKSYRAEATKPGFEQDYRNALSTGIDALRDQMMRGGGSDVVGNLANADQAWKQIKIVEKATTAARNGARSGEVGLPMPSHFNDAATAAAQKYGGPRFNGEFLDAAQRIIPNKVPDSGTAGRFGFGAMVAGGAGVGGGAGALGGDAQSGAATGLGVTLLLAAGGSRPAQRALTATLAERPDLAVKLGDILYDHARIGGMAGAGTSAALVTGN